MINTLNPIWLQHRYKKDDFYKYAISNILLAEDLSHKAFFSFVCHHRYTNDFVGYVKGYILPQKNAIWIQSFLVDRKFLRQGYGTEFYYEIVKLIQEQINLDKIFLSCHSTNFIGIHFWENLNFVQVSETTKNSLDINKSDVVFIYEHRPSQL